MEWYILCDQPGLEGLADGKGMMVMNSFVQSMKRRIIALAVVLIVVTAGVGWWYVNHYTKTPEYTIKMVQEAVADHNKDKLYKYVDVDHMLDTASDAMLDGLVQASVPAAGATKDAISSLTMMFKSSVMLSLQEAVGNYVEFGSWSNPGEKKDAMAAAVDANMVVYHLGLPSISFQKLESMVIEDENGIAVAKVRVHQADIGEDFVLDVELTQIEDGSWQVYEITNFSDFVEAMQLARQKLVRSYLDESDSLMKRHDHNIQAAEQQIGTAIREGSLGSNATREAIKNIVETQIVPDWEQRKSELEALKVPEAAGSLHRLRLKICEARISYNQNYLQWLDDKKATSIRAADNNLKTARTLEKDAELLSKQVYAHIH